MNEMELRNFTLPRGYSENAVSHTLPWIRSKGWRHSRLAQKNAPQQSAKNLTGKLTMLNTIPIKWTNFILSSERHCLNDFMNILSHYWVPPELRTLCEKHPRRKVVRGTLMERLHRTGFSKMMAGVQYFSLFAEIAQCLRRTSKAPFISYIQNTFNQNSFQLTDATELEASSAVFRIWW